MSFKAMATTTALATAPSEPNPTPDREAHLAYFRRVLVRLVEVSASMVEMEHDQARIQAAYTAETGVTVWPAPDRSVAIDRMARCIRRCIMLTLRLDEPASTPIARPTARAVEQGIKSRGDPGEGEALHENVRERMDAPDLGDEIDDRPPTEIIADICHTLGLATPPGVLAADRRQSEDVATLWARTEPGVTDTPAPTARRHPRPTDHAQPAQAGDGASVLLSEARFRGK